MESLFNLDYIIFGIINQKLSSPFLDFLLPWMRNEYVWVPLYIYIISFVFFNYNIRAYWILVFMFLTIGFSDMISSELIKKNVERDRPCRNEHVEYMTLRVKCGSGYSFTSSHAANHFAIATFLSFTLGHYFKKIRYPLYLWAGLICLAQVYVGVHFPLDVVCGAMLGFTVGYLLAAVFNYYYGHLLADRHHWIQS